MLQTVTSTLLLYADDSCVLYQYRDVGQMEKRLNEDFKNLCDWFVENKLSIFLIEEKTKLILIVIKMRAKKIRQLNIKYKTASRSNRSWMRARRCQES